MKELFFATGNSHKADEIRAYLADDWIIKTLADLNYFEELPETGSTLEENAIQKIEYASQKFQMDGFSEDTGLEVYALHMKPGVHTAIYAGNHRSAEDNMDLLLLELKNIPPPHVARFRTVIALKFEGNIRLFEGIVSGRISDQKRGTFGFGYDPIFIPDEGDGRTFAEMALEEKKNISHRSRAVKKLVDFLNLQ